MWSSKNITYKKPYSVTGTIKFTGLKRKPKSIYVKIILLEQVKPRIYEQLTAMNIVVRKILCI